MVFSHTTGGHTFTDPFQEAFLTAYIQIDQLENPDAFPGWLKQIVVRKCSRLLRRSSRHPKSAMKPDIIPHPSENPDEEMETKEINALVQSTIAAHPEGERIVMILY